MREAIVGDWDNPFPKEPIKNVDILDDNGQVENTIVASEWAAEFLYPGWWRVNPQWQWMQDHPDVPYDPPVDDPDEPAA